MEAKLPIQVVREYLDNKNTVSGVPPGRCSSSKELEQTEIQICSLFRRILSPDDSSYSKNLKFMLGSLQNGRQRYADGRCLDENKVKLFSVHTGRWKLVTSLKKSMIIDQDRRLYAKDNESLLLYVNYVFVSITQHLCALMTPSPILRPLLTPTPTPSTPTPSTQSPPIKGGGEGIEVKSTVGKENKKESWTKIRTNTWFYEQTRLEAWGHKNPFDKDKGRCFACLEPVTINNFEAAHIIPRSKGGLDVVENLHVSCVKCNHGQGGMGVHHAYEWMLINNMPGLSFISKNDREFLIVSLLHREAQLLTAILSTNTSIKINKEDTTKLKPTSPLEHRLDTTWKLFQLAIPQLTVLHYDKSIQNVLPPSKTNTGSSCILM